MKNIFSPRRKARKEFLFLCDLCAFARETLCGSQALLEKELAGELGGLAGYILNDK